MKCLKDDLTSAIKSVTKDWKKAKRRADKEDRVSHDDISRMSMGRAKVTIRDAAFDIMPEAYSKASGGEQFPANARQIMYCARPYILETTGVHELNDIYFTQTLLKDYVDEHHPGWDIVWDARGHFNEPHTRKTIGLGGLEVRNYIAKFTDGEIDETPFQEPMRMISTVGPLYRYGAVLFIEKEGFDPLLKAVKISERYDIAITSTKGMGNAAECDLLAEIKRYGIKAYVVHDFDKAGFSILATLRKGIRGSSGTGDIVDLGFRLEDIKGLQREQVVFKKSDPTRNLNKNGATEEEIKILYDGGRYGQRVELNMMTADQFIEWLERKLKEHGIKKVIPDKAILEVAYKRAKFLQGIEAKKEELRKEIAKQKIKVPKNLSVLIEKRLKKERDIPWDEVIWRIARGNNGDGDGGDEKSEREKLSDETDFEDVWLSKEESKDSQLVPEHG